MTVTVAAGRPSATVTIAANDADASEGGLNIGGFTVSRTGSKRAPLTVDYVVTGSASAGTDYVALSGRVVIPDDQSSANVVVLPLDDDQFEDSETVTVVLTPDPDYEVGSPASATVTITSDDAPPDLVLTEITVPLTGGSGAPLVVSDTTRNQGAGGAPASMTRFYLSADLTLDTWDVKLDGSRLVPPLGPGQSSSGSTTVTIPALTPPGVVYVIGKADAVEGIGETIEYNNDKVTGVKLGGDLTVASVSGPPTAGPGSTMTVAETTENEGPGPTGPSITQFYLSTDLTLDSRDVQVGARAIPALAAGGRDAGSTLLMIPGAMSPGQYYLIAKADATDLVPELVEPNNVWATGLRIGGDLVVSSLDAAIPTVGAGRDLTTTDTTSNQGPGDAGPSVTRFYLSADPTLDAYDPQLGTGRLVPQLRPGESHTGSAVATIPAATPAGRYYILAKADAAESVSETVELNNVWATGVDVTEISVKRIVTLEEGAGRVDWGGARNLIAFDEEGLDGYFNVYTMRPDSSARTCVTCGNPAFAGVHVGNPAWHPSGDYLVFQAQKPGLPAAACPLAYEPGSGFTHDLWVMHYDSRQVWRLTQVDTFSGGVLHPHFSNAGDKLLWSERIGSGGDSLGIWVLKLADFTVPGGVPTLGNVQTLRPAWQSQFHESHGFDPTDRDILFSASLSPSQGDYSLDVYRLNLATGVLTNLSQSNTSWDEHGQWSPDGTRIAWMSSTESGSGGDLTQPKTDYWLMDPDGAGQSRLTFFNDSRYPEFIPGNVIVGDVSWSPDGGSLVAYLMYGDADALLSPAVALPCPTTYPNSRIVLIELYR